LAFGFGFIGMLILGFLCGYCLGRFALKLSETNSLLLSLVTGIGTLMLEATLLIIRLYRMDQAKAKIKEE